MWPTNDGLVLTYVAWPVTELESFRADVEGNLLGTLDLAGDLGQRVRAGHRVERLREPESIGLGSANSARCTALTELLEAPAA
jgi:hypothetical protein